MDIKLPTIVVISISAIGTHYSYQNLVFTGVRFVVNVSVHKNAIISFSVAQNTLGMCLLINGTGAKPVLSKSICVNISFVVTKTSLGI